MRAYWRDDLEEQRLMPACNESLDEEAWRMTLFDVVDMPEFETEEGFNMLIRHPRTGRVYLVCSIDFNFKHYVPRKTVYRIYNERDRENDN